MARRKTKLINRPWVRHLIGRTGAAYMWLVRSTSRLVADPPDFWEAAHADWPAIAVAWHGDAFICYVVMPDPSQAAVLVSRHADGEMMAAMARAGGYHVVRGQGANSREQKGTGGAVAFRNMMKTLDDGISMFATADIPPDPGRKVSVGMVALARRSGRPIYTMGAASSRRRILRTWDRMQIPLPFSTITFTREGPFYLDDESVSDAEYAERLKASLERMTEKSFAMADKKP